MNTLTLRRLEKKIKVIAMPSNPGLEKNLIIGFFILLIGLSIAYGYFVKQTIVNVVERREIGEEIADLGSRVSSQEVTYIELKNRIDLDFAYSLGYKDAENVKFVSREGLGKGLTINN